MKQLIDTSAWIDYFKRSGELRIRKLVESALSANEAVWCEMVILELQGSPKSRQNDAVALLEPLTTKVSINNDCWSESKELAKLCHKAGRPVPNTDLIIYATAYSHGCKLIHNDKHFVMLDKVSGLGVCY